MPTLRKSPTNQVILFDNLIKYDTLKIDQSSTKKGRCMPKAYQSRNTHACLFIFTVLVLFSCAPGSHSTHEGLSHLQPYDAERNNQPLKEHRSTTISAPTIHDTSSSTTTSSPSEAEIPSCSPATSELNDDDTWITIFIHGIMNVKPHLSLKNAVRFVTDSVHDTLYSRTVMIMRDDPFFYQNQVMHKIGLMYIDPKDTVPDQHSLRCMVRLFEELENIAQPNNNITNYYYAFGWNGLLSQRARHEAACHLFSELHDEISHFKQRGITPRIRIIGYSHGGNVALNMARVCKEYCQEQCMEPIYVDELILLGTPIKTENNCLAHSPYIRKVYNFYSLRDKVQQLDLFSHNQMFSRRLFIHHTPLIEPNKIVQVQLQITRMARSCHADAYNFEQSKQVCYNSVAAGTSHLLRDISPGHTELWFFGWTPLNYRKKYPLYPIPTVAFVPYLLPHLRTLPNNKAHVIVDIRPEHEFLIIKSAKKRLEYTVLPFISVKEMERLKNLTLEYAPVNHTEKEYEEHVKKAFREACRVWFSLPPGGNAPFQPMLT